VLDRFRIDNRTVIVTGASAGAGVAFAVAAAQAGANVAIGVRRLDQLRQTRLLVEHAGVTCQPDLDVNLRKWAHSHSHVAEKRGKLPS
jgi:NADP-dependent 3-hydroxy acid dehydrogenase YdfG